MQCQNDFLLKCLSLKDFIVYSIISTLSQASNDGALLAVSKILVWKMKKWKNQPT